MSNIKMISIPMKQYEQLLEMDAGKTRYCSRCEGYAGKFALANNALNLMQMCRSKRNCPHCREICLDALRRIEEKNQ